MSDETLVAALAKAQSEFPTISKSHQAKVKMKQGGEYSYTYANLADTLEAVVPVLAKNGIALLQPIITTAAGVEIQTVLLGHGDRISSSMPLDIGRLAPQEIGSLISYYRRYLLTSLLALAVDDDDGKSANDARRDPHNFTPTVKAIVDGLVDAGVWPDDNSDWVTVVEPQLVQKTTVVVRFEPRAELAQEGLRHG